MADHLYALPSGHRLENYEFEQVLSVGRYGIKYRVKDHRTDHPLAIKEYLPDGIAVRSPEGDVVPTSTANQASFATGLVRFLDEAQGQAKVRHVNLVKVHRSFRANGTAYVVLDYAEGQTLSALLDGGKRLSEDELREIIEPILQPLGQLHDIGLLHHDIRPGTIVLQSDGSPLLLEVGASRQSIGGARQAFGDRSQGTELMVPTAGYAAVEQYSAGSRLGAWTDIYGLGAVMYRCVTGRRPPDAPSRVVDDDLIPAVRAGAGRHDAATLAAIDAALALTPGQRPASMRAWRNMFPESWHEAEEDDTARPGHLARRSTRVAARGFAQAAARGVEASATGGGGARRWLIPTGAALAFMALLTWVDVGMLRDGDRPVAAGRAEAEAPPAAAPDGEAIQQEATAAADAAPDAEEDAPAIATLDAPPDEALEADEALAAEESAQGAESPAASDAEEPSGVAAAQDTSLDGAEESLAETLDAADMATLVVDTDPIGVEVWLDDELVGTTPLELAGVVPGMRVLSLRREGYRAVELPEQSLEAGAVTRIYRLLDSALGALAISSEPTGAWIEVNGERLAETTPATLEGLPVGPIEVLVGVSGYEARSVRGVVPQDDVGELSLTLERLVALGTLTLSLTPPDAAVELLEHDAPYEPGMALPSGSYQVQVSLPGYETQTRAVEVTENEEAVASIDLMRSPQPFTVAANPAEAVITLLDEGLTYAPGMPLPRGDYGVRVEASGCQPFEETIAHGEVPTLREVTLRCESLADLLAGLNRFADSGSAGALSQLLFSSRCEAQDQGADQRQNCLSVSYSLRSARMYVAGFYVVNDTIRVLSCDSEVRGQPRDTYVVEFGLREPAEGWRFALHMFATRFADRANALQQELRRAPGACGEAGNGEEWASRLETLLTEAGDGLNHRVLNLVHGDSGFDVVE